MIDLTINTEKPTSLAEVIAAFRRSSKLDMAGVLKVSDEELVSSDYNGSSYSAVIDAPSCMELNPQVCHFNCRCVIFTFYLQTLSSSRSWLGTTMNGVTLIDCWT